MSSRTKVLGEGRSDAYIMVVDEAPGNQEAYHGRPFMGGDGQLLWEVLEQYGVTREQVYVTNVCKYRPEGNDIKGFFYTKMEGKRYGKLVCGKYVNKLLLEGLEELKEEIDRVKPNIIIALGNVALWGLTGECSPRSNSISPTGITQWRGSMMKDRWWGRKVLPTLRPANVLKQYGTKWQLEVDLKRAVENSGEGAWPKPEYVFRYDLGGEEAVRWLQLIPEGLSVAVDIETYKGFITCIGLATSREVAMCINFVGQDGQSRYSVEEEAGILWELKRIMEKCEVVGQNFMYDSQYMARFWGIRAVAAWDTMHAQHVLLPGQPKGLDFLSSLYCDYHRYWKDEGKEWDPKVHTAGQLWEYNCKDVVTTYEVYEKQTKQMSREQAWQYTMFNRQVWPVLKMQMQGIRADTGEIGKLTKEVKLQLEMDAKWFEEVVAVEGKGAPWWNSPKKLSELLYNRLRLPVQKGKERQPTVNDAALEALGQKEPLVRPLTNRLREYRTRRTLLNNFLTARLYRNRIYSSVRIDGTETFRYSSSRSVFGCGANTQNVTKYKGGLNLRRVLAADARYVLFECDLKQADAQVVAWEAGDEELMRRFRDGRYNTTFDLHTSNADAIGCTRQQAKAGVHAVNYGATARVLAPVLGVSVRDAKQFIARWFRLHPAIPQWHERVRGDLLSTGQVSNSFGYSIIYMGRAESNLKEALAWVPQSTVAWITSRALVALDALRPTVIPLIHGHDSVVFQVLWENTRDGVDNFMPIIWRKLHEASMVPYKRDVPLEIPWDISFGPSWGSVTEAAWSDFSVEVE